MFRWSRLALAGALICTLVPLQGPVAAAAQPAVSSTSVSSTSVSSTSVSSTSVSSTSVAQYSFPITRSGRTYALQYCATGSVAAPSAAVTRLVLVVHGDQRNACDYAGYVAKAAATAGQLATTLVVAPHFVTRSEVSNSNSARSSSLYWSSSGWKTGDESATSPYSRAWHLSSYDAVDLLLADVAASGRFPGLRNVVVAGHSAGGQFVNRYAAGAKWRGSAKVSVRYVVANPSSYLYWDTERLIDGKWRTPRRDQRAACPGYNDYKYGLRGRTPYMASRSEGKLKANYAAASVSYLMGAADKNPASSSLDTSCAARMQGSQRLERGQRYFDRLPAVLGPKVTRTQTFVLVPGVGHSGEAMFNSQQGIQALLG